jgi:hypothetical protein
MIIRVQTRVIPRLAQRAEGPLSWKFCPQANEERLHDVAARNFRESDSALERSLDALRQPRDDNAFHSVRSNKSCLKSFHAGFSVRTRSFFFSRRQPLICFSREIASYAVLKDS